MYLLRWLAERLEIDEHDPPLKRALTGAMSMLVIAFILAYVGLLIYLVLWRITG